MPGCKNLLSVMYDFSRIDQKKVIENKTPGTSTYDETSGKSIYQYFDNMPHNELQELMSEGN